MVRFKIASAGDGGIEVLVTYDISLKVSSQYF